MTKKWFEKMGVEDMNYSKQESWYRDSDGVIHTYIVHLEEKTEDYQAGWYFVDVAYTLDGPYETLEVAETCLNDYARNLGDELGYVSTKESGVAISRRQCFNEARGIAMNAEGSVDGNGVVSDLRFKSFDLTRGSGISGTLRKPIGTPDLKATIDCGIKDPQVTSFDADTQSKPLPEIDRNTSTLRALDIEGLQKFRDSHNFPPLFTPETFANLTPEDWSGENVAREFAEGFVKHACLVSEKLDKDRTEDGTSEATDGNS